ncbi:MAG: hypothetical protein MJZ34_14440 [Paludibacteraceae bacterium]|nr:hypothetical protein [Paludibacteraceae bacterium]
MIYVHFFIEWHERQFLTEFYGFKDSAQYMRFLEVSDELFDKLLPYEEYFSTQLGSCEIYDENRIPIKYDYDKELAMGNELAEKMIEVKNIYHEYLGDDVLLENLDEQIDIWMHKNHERSNNVFSGCAHPYEFRDIKTFYDFSGLGKKQKALAEKQLKKLLDVIPNPLLEHKNSYGNNVFDDENGSAIYKNLPVAIEYFTRVRDILTSFPDNKADLTALNELINALVIDNQDSEKREFIHTSLGTMEFMEHL